MITVDIEVTADDKHFRILKHEVVEVNNNAVSECLKFASKEITEDEMVYQLCAKRPHVEGETLAQPFWDFFNQGGLLASWQK